MKGKIWLYWEGNEIPAYYALCQETVLRHNDNVELIGPKDLPTLVGDLPPILEKAYVTHRVDWIRKMLLHKQGGVYIDSDFICLRSLEMFQEMARHFDYAGYQEWTLGGQHMDNFVCAKQGSEILRLAADYALEILELKGGKISWLEAATDAVNYGFKELTWKVDWTMFPTHMIEPRCVTDRGWFLERVDRMEFHHCYGYMTSFHNLRSWAESRSRLELTSGKERVCHIFRKALA